VNGNPLCQEYWVADLVYIESWPLYSDGCEAFSNSYQITYFNKLDKYSYECGLWLSRISSFVSSIKLMAAWQMQSRKSSSHKCVKVIITQSFANSTQNWVTVTALNMASSKFSLKFSCTGPVHPSMWCSYPQAWQSINYEILQLPLIFCLLWVGVYIWFSIYLFIGAILKIPPVGVNTTNKEWTHPRKTYHATNLFVAYCWI
jgi:hypothetical protein